MLESISIVSLILKAFSVFFVIVGLALIIWGLTSVASGRTRVFGDSRGRVGASTRWTILSSILLKKFNPVVYRRIMTTESKGVKGKSAKMIGIAYIILGVTVLTISLWFIFYFN